jgi:hypothetical protein
LELGARLLWTGVYEPHLGDVPDVGAFFRIVAKAKRQDLVLALGYQARPPAISGVIVLNEH